MYDKLTTVLAITIVASSFMSLTRATAAQPSTDEKSSKQISVAIVLFDGVQIIDYSGPWEVFGQAGFKVFTVADKTDPLTTRFDQKVVPDYSFDNGPAADIILIPGGRGTSKAADNPRAIKRSSLTTRFDQKVVPDYSFDNGPAADI